jgi:hypothetical protein
MNEILLAITTRIAQQVPTLQTIDIDWGQLDEDAEKYPVMFPCALVDVPTIDHEKTMVKIQPGMANITVKVGIQIAEDTYYGSNDVTKALNRLKTAAEVNQALRLWESDGFGNLERVKTSCYNRYGIKIVEYVYEAAVVDL